MSQETPAERLSPIIMGPSPSHAERARTLVDLHRQGTLCTLLPPHVDMGPPRGHDDAPVPVVEGHADPLAGYPYGSVVNYALDPGGAPILLTSALAEHTRNFSADPRASLFVHEFRSGHDVLALGRVTLLGRIARTDDRDARARYLERHPESAYYADFKDFAFYCLEVEGIRYIGGFGRMSWTDVTAYAAAEPDPTAAFAADVVTHMNEDHGDALLQLCRHPAGLDEVSAAEMKAVDCHGFEMSATTPRGPRFVRLGFPARVTTPDEVRKSIIAMLTESRKATR
jgi:putative heme iron utilization protein